MDFCEVGVGHSEEMGTVILVFEVFVGGEEVQHPPVVPSAVYFAPAWYFDVGAVVESYKILVVLGIGSFGVVFHIFGGDQLADYLDGDVVNVLDANGHGEKLFVGDSDCPLLIEGGIGSFNGFENGLAVFELVVDGVWVGNGSESQDVEDWGD